MSSSLSKFNYKYIVITLIFFSIIVASLIWTKSLNYYNDISKNRFEHIVKENIDNLEKRMSYYEHALRGGVGLVNSNNNITKTDWYNFVEAINIKKNYPGIQGIGYSPIIYSRELHDIYPEGIREKYVPVIFIEPLDKRNKKALNYDIYSEKRRKVILDLARDTGLASLTKKIILLQEINPPKQPGILMYIPVYKNNMQTSIEERRKSILGFVSGVFRMNDLLENITLKQSTLNFEIYESKNESKENLLYKSFEKLEFTPLFNSKKQIKVNNQTWYINYYSTKAFENKFNYNYPIYLTLLGIIIYFILLLILLYVINTKRLNLEIANKLRKTNNDLTSNQGKYKALVDQSLTGIYIYQGDKFLFVNQRYCDIFGYTEEEFKNKVKPINLAAPDGYSKVRKEIDDKYSGKKNVSHYIARGAKKDGTLIWLENYGNTIDINGAPAISGTVIDITERLEAEEQVDNLFNFSNVGLAITTKEKEWLHINKKTLDILGYSKEELLQTTWNQITFKEDIKKDEDLYNEIIEGKRSSYHIEKRFIKKDGELAYTILTISVFKENDKIKYFLASILDITEIKTKNALLFQQSKMAAMGEMIGNIAHQWKQPLSIITTASTGAKIQKEMDVLTDEQLYQSLNSINDSAQYLSQTIDDFRNFFKPNKEKDSFDISNCVSKSLKLVSYGLKNKGISVIQNVESTSIKTFENDLIQVLINILNNAKDALLDKETDRLIIIATSISNDKKNLVISIKDNAGGIPENIIGNIFKPYFTTKDDDKGTGIGLYMVNEIIKKNIKGEIRVENVNFSYQNKEYFGAEFKIYIALI